MVWCLRKLQENIFGWFQTFVIFGHFLNFVHFFWPTMTKITSNEKQSLILRLLKSNSSFPEVAYCPEWAKMIEMFNHGPKSLKIKNLAKIISSNFFKNQAMYSYTLYAKQNLPYWVISGKKDFRIYKTMPTFWPVKVVTLTLTHPVLRLTEVSSIILW